MENSCVDDSPEAAPALEEGPGLFLLAGHDVEPELYLILAPVTMFSTLACVAPVIAMVSPVSASHTGSAVPPLPRPGLTFDAVPLQLPDHESGPGNDSKGSS